VLKEGDFELITLGVQGVEDEDDFEEVNGELISEELW
jgi:hypothetical protein